MPNGLEKKKWTKWRAPFIAVLALAVVIIWGMITGGPRTEREAEVKEKETTGEETSEAEEREPVEKVAGGKTVSEKEESNVKEQEWFRKGQPISFANKSWTPKGKEVELADKDMRIVGEFQEFNIYVKESDKEPYRLVYIKTEAQSKYQPYEIYIPAPGLG